MAEKNCSKSTPTTELARCELDALSMARAAKREIEKALLRVQMAQAENESGACASAILDRATRRLRQSLLAIDCVSTNIRELAAAGAKGAAAGHEHP